MAFTYYDRIKETSTTTGTGDLILAGAVSQFQTFASRYSNGDNFYYCIADQVGTSWETGVGTFNSGANSISRTAVLESTNSNSAVNFTSASLFIFTVYAASAYVSSNIASGSAVSLTTATTANVTSISLPAGDWLVSGNVAFTAAGTTTATSFTASINSTSATLPTSPGAGAYAVDPFSISAAGVTPVIPTGTTRITLTATTTVYLLAQATFAISTMSAFGFIQAWRR